MKIFFFLSLFLLLTSLNISLSKNAYDNLLEWGKNNKLVISPKLVMKYLNEDNKNYFSNSAISKDEYILTVPSSLFLNLENSFKMFKSKKFSDLYNIYKEEKPKTKIDFLSLEDTTQQSFLAYIMYVVNRKIKHYQKSKFYKHFHYFFDTLETNMDSHPLFYNKRQRQLLQGTITSKEILTFHLFINDEMEIFKDKLGQKEISVVEDFYRYRIFAISKAIKIGKSINIVPFVDLFETDPVDYNLDFKISETGGVEVFATKDIAQGEKLIIKAPYLMNSRSFLLFGKTYQKMANYVKDYKISAISETLMRRKGVDVEEYDTEYKVDLLDDKFVEEVIPMYKDFSKKAKEDGSDLSAFGLLYANVKIFRDNLDEINTSHLHSELYQKKDIENVKRILEMEKITLDKGLLKIGGYIEKLKNVKVDEKKEKNKDL